MTRHLNKPQQHLEPSSSRERRGLFGLRLAAAVLGLSHLVFVTRADFDALSGTEIPFAVLKIAFFFGWPYWALLLVSFLLSNRPALNAAFVVMILLQIWLWAEVMQSDSSTAVLGLMFIPLYQFVGGTSVLLLVYVLVWSRSSS